MDRETGGRVIVGEEDETVQVAAVNGQPVQISMQKMAVQTLLPKDTFKPA